MSNSCVIGVDLGGTNVRACAFDAQGRELSKRIEIPSKAQSGTPAILAALAEAINGARESSSATPTAVGLAIPGFVDNEAGEIRWAPNFGEMRDGIFYHWQHVQVRKPLEESTGLPVYMGNDANLATLGEYKYGSGKGTANCLVMLTLGTGIGGGIVLAPASVDGNAVGPMVFVGGNKGGAELGHMIIQHQGLDCNSGSYGSVEAYCSRDAIIRRAIHRLNRGRKSIISDLVFGDLSKIQPKTIFDACEKGDAVAIEVFEEVGTMLGVAIGNYITIFAPDVFAIGGQIALAGDWIMKPAIKSARNTAVATLFEDCRIGLAEQLDDAGMLGAAALATEALTWKR